MNWATARPKVSQDIRSFYIPDNHQNIIKKVRP